MKRIIWLALVAIVLTTASGAYARGGFSSGGRGGFSSGRSFSASRSYSSPSRSYSSRSYSAPRTVSTTTIARRSSYGGDYYRGGYGGGYGYYHPMMYPGFGMGGYGYSHGIMTGLIIGQLMHPQGTTVYQGGGYGGSALLYPNGMVVDQNGYQVGQYANNQFTAVQGGMVAQPAPPLDQQGAQPQAVVVQQAHSSWTAAMITCAVLASVIVLIVISF